MKNYEKYADEIRKYIGSNGRKSQNYAKQQEEERR